MTRIFTSNRQKNYVTSQGKSRTNILLFYTIVMQAQITGKRRRIAATFAVVLLTQTINALGGYPLSRNLLNIACCMLLVPVVFEKKRLRWFLMYPCVMILSSILNVAGSFLTALCLGMPQSRLADHMALSFLCSLFAPAIVAAAGLYRKRKKTERPIDLFQNNEVCIGTTIGAFFFCLLIGLIQLVSDGYELPIALSNWMGLAFSAIGIIFFVAAIRLANSVYQNSVFQNRGQLMELYMAEQKKYIRMILEKDQDMRKFRHDVNGHFGIIMGCIKQKDYEKAQAYLEQFHDSYQGAVLKRYSGITSWDVILNEGENRMLQSGIAFDCEICVETALTKWDDYDLCTVLMNLLGNAIEACETLEEQDRRIRLVIEGKEDRLYIREQNVWKEPVRFDENSMPISRKADRKNHGYGSRNIKEVVEKYSGVIRYSTENGEFQAEIIL